MGTATPAEWRRSSYSGTNANCVEIARSPRAVAVRDAKDPGGPALTFPADAFTEAVRSVTG
jgi:hypothetical protein